MRIPSWMVLFTLIVCAAARAQVQMWPDPIAGGAVSRGGVVGVARDGQFTLYPKLTTAGSFDGAITAATSAEAVAVAHKQVGAKGYFVVLTKNDSVLHVIDDVKGTLVNKITLPQRPYTMLAPAYSEKSPWVYYSFSPANGNSEQMGLGRVDLAKMADDGELVMDEKYNYQIAASADGDLLYARRTNVSPAGVHCFQVLPPARPGEKNRATKIFYDHRDCDVFLPDPLGQTVMSGNQLYSRTLGKPLQELPGIAVAISSSKPVMFVTGTEGVTAISTNTYAKAGSVEYSAINPRKANQPANARARRNDPTAPKVWWAIDEKNQVLLNYTVEGVHAIKFSEFRLPNEPFLHVDVDGGRELQVGQPWKVKLVKRDPATKLELKSPPQGLALSGDTLTWTPDGSQVGSFPVKLTLSGGTASRVQEVGLTVRRGGLDLPFVPQQMKVTRDGKFALIANLGDGDNRRRGPNQEDNSTRLAIIDLTTLKVVSDRQLDQTLTDVAIDADGVYATLRDSSAFLILSPKDLTDVKRIFTTNRPWRLMPAGQRLFVTEQNGGVSIYTKPSFDPVQQNPNENMHGDRMTVASTGNGWFWRGGVFDDTFTKTLLSPQFMQLPLLADPPQMDYRMHGSDVPAYGPWGVVAMNNQLMRNGQALGNSDHGQMQILLEDLPAAVMLQQPNRDNYREGEARSTVQLVVKDLVLGTPSKPFVLMDEPRAMRQNNSGEQRMALAAGKGVVVAQAMGKLFVLPTSEFKPLNLPTPLHILPQQSALQIDAAKPTKLTYTIAGGKAPLTCSLVSEMPGVSIDAKTGDITIDPRELLAKMPDRVLATQRNNGMMMQFDPQTNQPLEPEEVLKRMTARANADFKKLTGKDATGFPVSVIVGITVRDAEQQTARLQHAVIIDAPSKPLLERLAADQQKIKAQRDQQAAREREMRERAAAAGGGVGVAGGEGDAALRARINDLERKNAALEAKVELLTQLLGQQRGGATSQPGR